MLVNTYIPSAPVLETKGQNHEVWITGLKKDLINPNSSIYEPVSLVSVIEAHLGPKFIISKNGQDKMATF